MGLEQFFIEDDDPYEVSFSDLFKRKNRLSLTEISILLQASQKKREKELQEGKLRFHELLRVDLSVMPAHLRIILQKVLGPLTSKEFETIKLIFLENYSEDRAATKLRVARRTVRVYKQRALEKIFNYLPEQETNTENVHWDSPLILPLN